MSGSASIELAIRIADGRCTADDLVHLQRGFATWINAGGSLPLSVCLRMPGSKPALQRALRDLWLLELHRTVGVQGHWLGAVATANQLRRFVERGPWRLWKKLQDPPADATALDGVCFRVVKAGGGRPISAETIRRVVRSAIPLTKIGQEVRVNCGHD